MTERQCMEMLDEMHVAHVSKAAGGKMMLTVIGPDGGETLSVTEIKGRSSITLATLEERKKGVEENTFAGMMEGQLPTGADRSLSVKYLKRDDQLTAQEEKEKRQLLLEIGSEMSHHRTIVGAMNYLQIHFKDLEPKLARREMQLPGAQAGLTGGTKLRWTKGIKSAALYCLKESKKESNAGKDPLTICREFLKQYVIDGEENYEPEQLLRNTQQILQLERAR